MAENDKEYRDGHPLASAPVHIAVVWDDNDPELRLMKAVNALFEQCDDEDGTYIDAPGKRRVAAYILARWGR